LSSTEVGPPPPIDSECAVALSALPPWLSQPVTADTIASRRAGERNAPPVTDEALRRDGRFTVEERLIPGPDGAPEISVLICLPTSAHAPTPVVYHVHGGGLIGGNKRLTVQEVLGWAEDLEMAIVAIDYRLAPEHPYPAPVEDCYAGLLWIAERAVELNVDPARIIIAGVSAGAGLAAAVALLARDRGGPALFGQLLTSPMLDDRNDTVSARQMIGIGVWDSTSNHTGWTAYLGDARGGPNVSPSAAPARATDLSGLPPTFIDVGSAETFRDECVAYASRLWQSGGVCELHVWPGGFHGFSGMAPKARISQEAVATRLRWLRRLLANPPLTGYPSPFETEPDGLDEVATDLMTVGDKLREIADTRVKTAEA
jgi:acetyl esterase/lipase